jgi:hypothetical protein
MHLDQSSLPAARRKSAVQKASMPTRSQSRSSQTRSRRAAFARPRVLLAAVAAVVAGSAMWAGAQKPKAGATSPAATQTQSPGKVGVSKSGPVTLDDLSSLVRAAGEAKRFAAANAQGPRIGKARFGLTERDLTPGTVSDDRQPVFSPTGEFIAFVSNRTNAAGTAEGANYHIWIMNRDGSNVRPVTGLNASPTSATRDDNRDQFQPSWSPDGNQLVFSALGLSTTAGTVAQNTRTTGNLFTVRPFVDGNSSVAGVQPVSTQRTFFTGGGQLDRPDFGANGLAVVFAHTDNLDGDAGDTVGDFDIFSIAPSGDPLSRRRLTGGTADAAGQGVADRQPVFSLVNQRVVFFASARAGGLSRIFLMNLDGSGKRQVTNPADTAAADEYPAPSLGEAGLSERIAFQSNRVAAADDATRDTNIFSIEFSTAGLGPAPTATPVPTPRLVVSAFSASTIYEYDPATGGDPRTVFTGGDLVNPEGVIFGPDLDGDTVPEVLVANRGKNRVDAYNGQTGVFESVFAGAGAPAADDSLKVPSSLVFTGAPGALSGTLFVASGVNPGSTNKIHRYSVQGGQAFAAPAGGQTGSLFSNGTDAVANGFEGLARRGNVLYASAFGESKINTYDIISGTLNGTPVTSGEGGLAGPTGLTFGPNGNLFVSSSQSDDIIQYTPAGDVVGNFVTDANGAQFGLDGPEGLIFGPDGNLYVAAFDRPGGSGTLTDGRFVLRFQGTAGASPGAPLPATAPNNRGPVPGAAQDAVFAETLGDDGPAGLAFFPQTLIPTPTPTAVGPTPTPVPLPVVETAFNPAVLESSTISAPSLVTANRLEGLPEDRAADREPGFSRSNASNNDAAQLAFASTRRQAAQPGSSVVNAQGGDDLSTGGGADINRATSTPKHDIWTTASDDFTAPILVPVGAGNARFPVVAPGPQSPFSAPRTFEQGLTPGTPVRIAVVLEERESGLAPGSVTATIYNADQRGTSVETTQVNEKIRVQTNRETKPAPIQTITFTTITDAGAPAERQAGAVRGDGIYYCEVAYTPPTISDFYFDVRATDNENNSFLYDNIFGFSNRQFEKSSDTSDLFVSDYTQGQSFPNRSQSGDSRFFNQGQPVESYFLSNFARIAQVPVPFGALPDLTTFDNVDVWRIISRGSVPEEVMAAYAPTISTQVTGVAIDAASGTVTTTSTRNLAVASSSIIWASPYTAGVFTGPGTLADSETQRRLTNFLNGGGRLFVTGRDVAFALSLRGQLTNTFLSEELGTGYGGETGAANNVVTAGAGRFTFFPFSGEPFNNADFNNLQFPMRSDSVPQPERSENTFLDAATNQNNLTSDSPRGSNGTDIITPSPGITNRTLIEAYTIGGARVGQRIERTGRGPNGLQSKAVFFAFGLEGVNRRYTLGPPNETGAYPVNVRPQIADNILFYFKTGGISGRVINDATNQPIPNFFLQITRGAETFFVQTDQNGNYEIRGLENGATFNVAPAVVNGVSLNAGFSRSTSTPRNPSIAGPPLTTGVDFRIIPAPRGSVSGVATQSSGTFSDRTDDSPLPNVPVLLRSVLESSVFPGGGRFAAITRTDAEGRFNIANVPTGTPLEVIFNPTLSFISVGGDLPDGSGLNPTDLQAQGFQIPTNPAFGRRRIPDTQRPTPIVLDENGNNFVLNDPASAGQTDDAADNGVPILVPVGRTITGTVFLNGNPVDGATVVISGNGISREAAITVSNGQYAFFDIPTGTYTITATLPFSDRVLSGTTTASVDTAQAVDPVAPNIILTKQDVSGRVTVNGAAPGEPLTVALIGAGGSVVRTAQTDNAGNYVFVDVPVGTYTVRVTRRGRQVSTLPSGAPATVTVTAFTPTGPANAANILPGTGGDAVAPTINVIALGLSGNVTVNGVGTAGLRVEVLDAAGAIVDTQTSGANGAFAFTDLLNGNFTVRSTVAGRNGNDTVSVPVGLDATQADVQVPLFLYSLRGQVLFNGRPTSGQRVEVLQNGRVIATVQTDAGGTFLVDRLVAVPEGTIFQVRATRLVGSTVVDQTPLTSITITRGPNQPLIVDVAPLSLVTQTLTGRVLLNNRPLGGATVQLLRANRVILTTTSRADGTYTVADVPVGTFVLRATSRGDTVQRTVVVTRGRNQAGLDLRLLLQSIRGRVLLSGVPLRGQVVELLSGTRVIQRATTDATGTYTFTNLPVAAGVRASFVVRATRNGLVRQVVVSNVTRSGATFSAPNILLLTQVVRVTVRLNGVTRAGVVVELRRGTVVLRRVTSTTGGLAIFTDVPPFAYTVRAAFGGDSAEARANVVANGATTNVTLDLRLQTISGVVLANSTPLVGQVVELVQGAVVRRATSTAGGAFRFADVPAGAFVIRASRDGDTVSQALTITRGTNVTVRLVLRLQSVRGSVTLDGRPAAGILVTLARGGTGVASTRTAANGTYVFSGVAAGTYNVTASTGTGDSAISATRLIVVARGTDLVVPALALVTPAPAPGTDEFQPGSSFQISVPYADATAPTATTTVARAFSVPPISAGVENYRLFRFNALTREYEQLSASSIIRRGEGYFLQPQARGVSIRRPRATDDRPGDPTRLPTGVSEFEIKLRLSASVTDSNNGFNLIGFPFDPARFTVSDWQNASVIVPPSRDFPQGRRFDRLRDAVGAGVVSGTLFTLDTGTDTYSPIENTMVPFRGYYARTFVDNVTVILRAGPGPSTTTP